LLIALPVIAIQMTFGFPSLLTNLNSIVPFALKVGGLGDVVTGLSKALQKKGHLVEIVLPKYDCMNYNLIHDLRVIVTICSALYRNGIFFGGKIISFLLCLLTLFLQSLDVEVESYFDGYLVRNKIWVGTVEGQVFYFLL